jgi:hypothetical protein
MLLDVFGLFWHYYQMTALDILDQQVQGYNRDWEAPRLIGDVG